MTRVWKQTAFAAAFLAIVGVLRLSVFEIGLVTSRSMEPTLQKGDSMLVDHREGQNWQRGQIVLFSPPDSWGMEEPDEKLVKRIIGLPGETVVLGGGRISINGRILQEDYLKPLEIPDDGLPTVLGPDEYFVLGDNRDNSDDSRTNGPIKRGDIESRVVAVVFPTAHFGTLALPTYGN